MILVQQEGNRVAEHLSQQPGTQVPGILGPDSFGSVAVHQLAKDRVDTVAQSAEQGTPARLGVPLGRTEWRQQSHTFLVQLLGLG